MDYSKTIDGKKLSVVDGLIEYGVTSATIAGAIPTLTEIATALGAATLYETGTVGYIQHATNDIVFKCLVVDGAWTFDYAYPVVFDITIASTVPTAAELVAGLGTPATFGEGDYAVVRKAAGTIFRVVIENAVWYYEAKPTIAG